MFPFRWLENIICIWRMIVYYLFYVFLLLFNWPVFIYYWLIHVFIRYKRAHKRAHKRAVDELTNELIDELLMSSQTSSSQTNPLNDHSNELSNEQPNDQSNELSNEQLNKRISNTNEHCSRTSLNIILHNFFEFEPSSNMT